MYDEKRRKGEIAAAIEIGASQGFEKGHAEGLTEGISQVARNMLSLGFPYEQIAQVTGLDMDAIKKLAD